MTKKPSNGGQDRLGHFRTRQNRFSAHSRVNKASPNTAGSLHRTPPGRPTGVRVAAPLLLETHAAFRPYEERQSLPREPSSTTGEPPARHELGCPLRRLGRTCPSCWPRRGASGDAAGTGRVRGSVDRSPAPSPAPTPTAAPARAPAVSRPGHPAAATSPHPPGRRSAGAPSSATHRWSRPRRGAIACPLRMCLPERLLTLKWRASPVSTYRRGSH
jgi:hypothetical protein